MSTVSIICVSNFILSIGSGTLNLNMIIPGLFMVHSFFLKKSKLQVTNKIYAIMNLSMFHCIHIIMFPIKVNWAFLVHKLFIKKCRTLYNLYIIKPNLYDYRQFYLTGYVVSVTRFFR